MIQDIQEISAILLLVAGAFAISFCIVIVIIEPISSWRCSQYQEATGRDTKYQRFDKCYVKSNSEWYTLDEYKMSIAAKDSLTFEVE